MKWQPIETAPKDGTEILVCVQYEVDGDLHSERWVDWLTADGGWFAFPSLIWVPFRPTAWMPLPEPPAQD